MSTSDVIATIGVAMLLLAFLLNQRGRLAEDSLYELDAPIKRVCSREVPVPYAAHLEEAALPSIDGIVSAVRSIVPKRG